MFLIVGLGNYGKEYDNTRHNAGFIVVDEVAKAYNIQINKAKFKGLIGEGKIKGEKVILLKPQTYMNLSGESILEVTNYYNIENSNIIVIYDDIDIEVGKVRIRENGSAGTHNGMKSILKHVKDQNFPRIRVGIGPKPEYIDMADYVLSRFKSEERKLIDKIAFDSCDIIEKIMNGEIQKAMNIYN